jgi:hypothetical protein
MPRGIVLPFPPPRGLRQEDRECLRDLIGACPGTTVEFFDTGHRRGVATIGVSGRQVWVERDGAVLRVRDAQDGRLLAVEDTVGTAVTQAQTALLPGGMTVWGSRTGSLG